MLAAIINRLALPKKLKLRREIANDVKSECKVKFKWNGNLKRERRDNNIKYSGTLDKCKNHEDHANYCDVF